MTYQEAETFLFTELQSFQDKGRIAFNGTLDNALALSEMLDHPDQKFKSIHVGGTNGKGSVSHMIAAGIQANGYKVGLYTSPHYKSYRERIKINGELIPEIDVAEFITRHKEAITLIKPSFFEITCAMAFDHFAKNEVDIAIIEVGLGGRLDSTNIISPLISVITNISYDHQNILGNTLTEIAGEKAGIIKDNTPVVIGESQEEIRAVFEQKAYDTNSTIYFAEENSELEKDYSSNRSKFIFSPINTPWKVHFETQLTSPFQIKNLKTALYTLFLLKDQFNLEPHHIAHGIEDIQHLTYFIGRWSTIRENPKVIFDSAHNSAGVRYLVDQVNQMKYQSLRIVWGTTEEKDVDKILSMLPKDAVYYFCNAQNSRALDAESLRQKAYQFGLDGYAYSSVKVAYRLALTEAHPDDLIVVAGSTFVIAEII